MWQILGNLVLVVLLFFILYLVIGWAIDHSKTAKNLEIIKNILLENYPHQEKATAAGLNEEITQAPKNVCPGCGSKVKESDKFCTSCGIRVIS